MEYSHPMGPGLGKGQAKGLGSMISIQDGEMFTPGKVPGPLFPILPVPFPVPVPCSVSKPQH